jgi:hypothetical protein
VPKQVDISSCLRRASIEIKTLFIIPTDANYYKYVEILKQFKVITLARHVSVHAGTIKREQFCAWLKLQIWFFSVLVDMDSVIAMAVYRCLVQVCGLRTYTTR